jgi:hypothetical protein
MSTTAYLWLYWETPPSSIFPSYLSLCYQTIKKHCSSDFQVILLNEKTVYDYLPSLRLYSQKPFLKKLSIPQKTDIIRIFLLYHYGGIWLDLDTIVFQSLLPYYEYLRDYDYVGFGCNFGQDNCEKDPHGYGAPSNWCMISRPRGILMTQLFNTVNSILDAFSSSSQQKVIQNYHSLGKDLLRSSINACRTQYVGWDYLHIPSICVERSSDGKKITNERLLSKERPDMDSVCFMNRIFLPIYNTAPGFPSSFKNSSEKDILRGNTLIAFLFRKSLF